MTNKSLEQRVGDAMIQSGLKLAFAESCTGGLAGSRMTNVPGASAYFEGSIVSYSYQAKAALLGVSWETLNSYGAVSRETVLEMAMGAQKTFQVDIALSISGIAGPGGGTPEKPVGTTWIGLATIDGMWAREFHFTGDREQNKSSSTDAVFELILEYLSGGFRE